MTELQLLPPRQRAVLILRDVIVRLRAQRLQSTSVQNSDRLGTLNL